MKLRLFHIFIVSVSTLPVLGQTVDTAALHSDTGILLNTVKVTGRSFSTRVNELKQLQAEVNRKNGIFYHGRPPLILLNPFGGKPLTFFYELLSKDGKQARRMEQNLESEIQQAQIDRVFNAALVRSLLPISGQELEHFLRLYRPDYKMVSRWTSYDRDVYIGLRYEDFMKLDSIPPIPQLLENN